jgi:hypothetical protein
MVPVFEGANIHVQSRIYSIIFKMHDGKNWV